MCATEALMRARYGVATDKDGEPLLYDDKQEDFTIKNGFIMASNKSIYDLCNERLKPYLKDL
jgi:3'-phosphoadenosine 5'-phosphosulfate (PAPS) 3'-phosphatase